MGNLTLNSDIWYEGHLLKTKISNLINDPHYL